MTAAVLLVVTVAIITLTATVAGFAWSRWAARDIARNEGNDQS